MKVRKDSTVESLVLEHCPEPALEDYRKKEREELYRLLYAPASLVETI